MAILTLRTQKFRNLGDGEVEFDPQLNFFSGDNASGKTSLLEAIYMLSTGKSFRTRNTQNIVQWDSDGQDFILFGRLKDQHNGEYVVGIKKSTVLKTVIKVDHQLVSSAAVLAKLSPTALIDPSCVELLNGPPAGRRKFLDWGVFHVEHAFSGCWSDYIYCLKQRNTLLRNAKLSSPELLAWDKKLAELGEEVHRLRLAYTEKFLPILRSVADIFLAKIDLEVRYLRGWERESSLVDSLAKHRTKDLEKRFTQFGPHRADIKILLSGRPAEELLSRGQQKLLVIAMYLAQLEYLTVCTGKESVVLIDDFTAELDQENMERIFDKLKELDAQIICTTLDLERVKALVSTGEKHKVFHVEQGLISPVS